MATDLRPSTSKTSKAKVIAALIEGMSLEDAAAIGGVKKATVVAWKHDNEEFQQMLADASEKASEAIIDGSISVLRTQIKDLGPKALEILKDGMESDDESTRLRAAQMVFKMSNLDQLNVAVKVGLEQQIGALDNHSPALGD